MAGIISAVAHAIERMRHHLDRESIRRVLSARSDRVLEDIGVSRRLLDAGAGYSPWRADVETATVSAAAIGRLTNRLRLRRGFRELEARRGREAAHTAATRAGISDALRRGRLASGSADSWPITRKRLSGLSRLRASGS